MLVALEGLAGAGKSTLRDRILADAHPVGISLNHIGQFSWLSHSATRTLVRLRAGHPAHNSEDALEAACQDLILHARFNFAPALVQGSVLADRFSLSTACLLTLVHQHPVAGYIERLAELRRARPDLTILLTTDPGLCQDRIARRETARRFTEHPDTANLLADLYRQATTAWTARTGLPVWERPCATKADLDELAADCLAHLRLPARPQPPNSEASR